MDFCLSHVWTISYWILCFFRCVLCLVCVCICFVYFVCYSFDSFKLSLSHHSNVVIILVIVLLHTLAWLYVCPMTENGMLGNKWQNNGLGKTNDKDVTISNVIKMHEKFKNRVKWKTVIATNFTFALFTNSFFFCNCYDSPRHAATETKSHGEKEIANDCIPWKLFID